jgi:hypothetical protein
MWGIYEDGNPADGVSYSWKFDTDVSWQFGFDVIASNTVLTDAAGDNQDLGAWIVSNNPLSTVPEPSSLALLAAGLGAVVAWRIRGRRRSG